MPRVQTWTVPSRRGELVYSAKAARIRPNRPAPEAPILTLEAALVVWLVLVLLAVEPVLLASLLVAGRRLSVQDDIGQSEMRRKRFTYTWNPK